VRNWLTVGVLAVGLLASTGALAHGGGLDSLGCHDNRKFEGWSQPVARC